MKILSLYDSPEFLEACIDFVSGHFGNREHFEKALTECTDSPERLPQGYMLVKQDQIIGYCGLIEQEAVLREDLSPWISPLLIAEAERGNSLGAKMLEHVRREAGKLGFERVYLTTDHIGYYEKYGFREIGLTCFTWGRPTKIYEHAVLPENDCKTDIARIQGNNPDTYKSKKGAVQMQKDKLFTEQFPRSNHYDPDWIIDHSMGINALWLTEWLCQAVDLKPGMRVLDLGSGKAISSIFLAKEYGVQVWSYDLWIPASENYKRIQEWGLEDRIFPIHGDARHLPFAEGFFDAILSVDSYIYFGTDDLYLNYLQGFAAPGGILAAAHPGLMKEFENGVPAHLTEFWGQDCWSWHICSWWKKLWEKTGLVSLLTADTLPGGCDLYARWKQAQDEAGKNPWPKDTEILKRDAGEYVGFIRLAAQKKG